jgi:HAD superfamily hydrolase (TIGR01484 family)
MKYKLLLLDIDGTIIKIQENGHDLMPSEEIRSSIYSAGKKIQIGFATWRSYKSVQPLIHYLGICGLCVLNNGSQIVDTETWEIIFEKTIPTSIVADILQRLKSYDVYLGSGKDEIYYTTEINPEKVVSIYFKIPLSEIQEIEIFLSSITDISYHRFLTWEKDFSGLYISHSHVSKWYGTQELAKILNLSPQSFIGVGDSYNDISMLEICGKKIAMGNAIPELKSIADYIAPSIDDDGVIDIINTFVLCPSE